MQNCTQQQDLIRRFYRALDNNDQEELRQMLAADLVVYNPGPQNREANLRGVTAWHAAFSGNRLEILDMLCESAVVAARVDMHADHSEGEFAGVPPTGRHITIPAITFEHVREKRIVERWIVSERAGMRADLGLSAPAGEHERIVHEGEDNKQCAARFYAAFAANDQAALHELLDPDFVIHVTHWPEPVNREGHLRGIKQFTSAFENLQMRFRDQIAHGDLVASRLTWCGINMGRFQNHAPTGKTVQVRAYALERFANGRIVERWFYQDIQALQQQLGIDLQAAGE